MLNAELNHKLSDPEQPPAAKTRITGQPGAAPRHLRKALFHRSVDARPASCGEDGIRGGVQQAECFSYWFLWRILASVFISVGKEAEESAVIYIFVLR